MKTRLAALSLVAFGITAAAQVPTFEVVSIRHDPAARCCVNNRSERPGGGFTLTQGTIAVLIGQAYAVSSSNVIGLPEWATNEAYDIMATASLIRATMEDRRAMKQALLADRFKFRAHFETRERPAYDLVKSRLDGRLGPGLVPYEVDCITVTRAVRAAEAAGEPPPPESVGLECGAAITRGGLGGTMPMSILAGLLGSVVGRPVVDNTGIEGSYRVKLTFDQQATARADAPSSDLPSLSEALPTQLGLKLEPSRTQVQVLVVDSIERPTPN